MWSKAKLVEKLKAHAADRAAMRDAALNPTAEYAALLYARWQGLTDESKALRAAAKAELDALIDGMEPEDWSGIEAVADGLGDATYRGLLTYCMKRALAATTVLARGAAKARDWPVG